MWKIMCIFIVNKWHARVCKNIKDIRWHERIIKYKRKKRINLFNKITVFNLKQMKRKEIS